MSLAIDQEKVMAILLPDGKWYELAMDYDGKSTFCLDAYEYLMFWENPPGHKKSLLLYNGERDGSATGFTFLTVDDERVFAPMSSLVAVRY